MTNRTVCSICRLPLYLAPYVVGEGGRMEHASQMDCIRVLKLEFEQFLAIAGARIDEEGELCFTSYGYGQWSKRKGCQVLQDRIDELERIVARRGCGAQIKPLAASESMEVGQ